MAEAHIIGVVCAVALAGMTVMLIADFIAMRAIRRALELSQTRADALTARIDSLSDRIDRLPPPNPVGKEVVADFGKAITELQTIAKKHYDGLINHKEWLDQLHASVEQLSHITQSTVDACGAAQAFYDGLVARHRVPEQELIALGKALDSWQRKGKLN